MTNLEILHLSSENEKLRWLNIWKVWGEEEVYAHPDFVELNINNQDEGLAIYLETDSGGILFPLIKKEVSSEQWCSKVDCYDVVTPYGYGGAFCWGDGAQYKDTFWEQYRLWCRENKIVSTLMRLSLFEEQVLASIGKIESPYGNIVRSLQLEEEELWYDYKHAVRKNIKRSVNSGLQIEVDLSGEKLEDFLRIYYSTMDRVSAKSQYYFSVDYFKSIIKNLSKNYAFFHVLHEGKVISTELVLVSYNNIYSFLGGTDPEYSNMRPNNFLKHEIIKWGIKNGKSNFVLGGGYKKDDGIFKYKQAMAPNGERPFYLAKVIHDADMYKTLVKQKLKWKERYAKDTHTQDDFFPKYRA